MLTSSANQYLRPEYLSPLPTTLDAKKSPLALLAQTCSNIGADTNSKPLITQSDRNKDRDSDKKKNGRDSSSVNSEEGCNSVQSNKFSFKPYESSITSSKKDRDSSDRSASVEVSDSKKSPHHKVSSSPTSNSSHSHANNNNNSSSVRASPTVRSSSSGKSSPFIAVVAENGGSNSVKSDNGKPKSPSNSSSTSSNGSSTSNNMTHTTTTLSDLARGMDSHELSLHYAAVSKANGLNFSACCPTPASAAAALGNLKGVDNKSQPYPTFSPYSLAGYGPLNGVKGSFLSASPCREPNCYNCQFNAAVAGRMAQSVCPSGCTQCNHERIPSSLLSPNYSTLQALGPMAAYNSSLYHAFAQTGSPLVPQSNVCSWMMAGDRYCGKRFATSEELLNHLRTHTSGTAAEVNANSMFNPLSSLSACHYANQVSAAASMTSNSPLSLTTSAGLRRTAYPSLSDVSSLANRYHPYKPTAMPVIGGIPTPQLSNIPPIPAALSMYYSPYALHGQRIGPPVHQ